MGIPESTNFYIPPPLGVVELNFGDEWRARWVDAQTLPAGTPVDYVYALVCMGDNGYLTREVGSESWGTVEGRPETAEQPLACVKRATKEQTGAVAATVELIGYLECRATSHNREHKAGTARLRPFYVVAAKQVKDLGRGATHERRRVPLNQHMAAIRKRYPEFEDYFSKAASAYALLRARQS